MPLTGKQKRLLKQRGQTLADGCQLGKARLTDEFLDHLNGLLEHVSEPIPTESAGVV